MRFLGVIPARFASSRLPGKPLLRIQGKPLIQYVYQQAVKCPHLSRVVVATDDERIESAVKAFGGQAVLTAVHHRSGSDRTAEVAQGMEADVYINIQGDEPLISPSTIDAVCGLFLNGTEVALATARVRIPRERSEDPNVVKVVVDHRGRALYFSRCPIPFDRSEKASYYKHLGIYGYRRQILLSLNSLAPSGLEEAEKLEQLRWLENGLTVHVVEVTEDSLGVDTSEDFERVRVLLENGSNISEVGVPARGREV